MRIGRGCVVSLVVLVLLAAAGAFLVRRALDPEALRRAAQSRLSAAFGQPVSIGRMNLHLLPTPSVEGGAVTTGQGAAAAVPGLSLATLRIVPRVSSLFSRPIVVDRLEIEGLVIRALRTKDGKWILPLPAPSADGNGQGGGVSVNIGRAVLKDGALLVVDESPLSGKLERARHATRDATPGGASADLPGIRSIDATLSLSGGEARFETLTGRVGESRISGRGAAGASGVQLSLEWQSLRRADLPQVFGLLGTGAPAGLTVEGDTPLTLQLAIDAQGTLKGEGRLAASRAALGTLTLTSLASPLHIAAHRVTLDPLTFALYGGTHRGVFVADTAAAPISWTMRSALDGVDVDALLSANTAARNKVAGTGRLQADLRGTAAVPIERGMTGTIALDIARGTVREFPLLAAINRTLGLGTSGEGDRDLRFDALSGTLAVANGALTTDDLTAISGDLTLQAAGSVRFDLALDLAGVARFTRAKSDEMVRHQKHVGGLRNPQGEVEVPFTVTGSASQPSFTVSLEKVMKRAAEKELKRQLRRRLQDIIKF